MENKPVVGSSSTTVTVTSFVQGTATILVQNPSPTTSIITTTTTSNTTTWITTGVDSGTGRVIMTSTIAATSGIGTIQIIYPTPACNSKGARIAQYKYTGNASTDTVTFSYENYKLAKPTATAIAKSYIGVHAASGTDSLYGQYGFWRSNVIQHDFYIYAGRGSGNYTFYLPWSDDTSSLWIGGKAVSGWNATNMDFSANYIVRGSLARVAVSVYLSFGTYTPVRYSNTNFNAGAVFPFMIYAPDGSALNYAPVNMINLTDTSVQVAQGFMTNNIVTNPCQAREALLFPAWGAET